MGKSSLLNAVKASCSNKQNKSKFYAFTVDSINAETEQFVGLAFQELLKKAIAENFIKDYVPSTNKISFISAFDLLSDSSVKSIIDYLKANNKILILIFDQFEDVFRRDYLYKPFHEFLLQINNEQANIVVGFSWKNEITLSPESGSYKFWQQAKGLGIPFELIGFNNEEINLIIEQLENEPKIGKLSNSLKSLLIENSQGYPWLIKKLCIHIFNEVVFRKQKISALTKANLHINNLFKKDIEELTGIESNALMTIAKNARRHAGAVALSEQPACQARSPRRPRAGAVQAGHRAGLRCLRAGRARLVEVELSHPHQQARPRAHDARHRCGLRAAKHRACG